MSFKNLRVGLFGFLCALLALPAPAALAHGTGSNFKVDLLESCDTEGEGGGRQVDLMLLIDQSKSLKGANLRALENALRALEPIFSKSDERVHVGVATFSGGAQLQRSLSSGAMKEAEYDDLVRSLTDENRLQGGTNYVDATTVALDDFRSNSAPGRCKVLIWFTDGEVDLPGEQNRIREGDAVISDFCEGADSSKSKASSFRDLGIRPYVVLLTPEPFKTEVPAAITGSKTSSAADPYRKWGSIVALRGLTGDWSDEGSSATKPGSSCDRFADDWGELIQVSAVSASAVTELAQQMLELLMKGTSVVPPDLCPNKFPLEGFPAGVLLEKLVVSLRRSTSPAGGPALVEPEGLNGVVEGNLLFLSRADAEDEEVLNSLPAGWNLKVSEGVESVCFGFEFRDPADLEFVASPNQLSVHVPSRKGENALTADISYGEFDAAIDQELTKSLSPIVTLNGATATIKPNASQQRLETLPASLALIPRSLGPAGRIMLENSPLIGSLRLSPAVDIAGIEDLPSLSCSENDELDRPVLEIKAIKEEVSESPYRSKGNCSVVAGAADVGGKVRFVFSDPDFSDPGQGGFAIQVDGEDLAQRDEVSVDVSRIDAQGGISVFVGQSAPFPNRSVDVSRSTEMIVVWEDVDESIELGRIQVLANLSLEGRSNKVLALIIAIVASLLSALLAYVLLFFVVRKSTRVGRPSDLVFLTADVSVVQPPGRAGGGVEWPDRESFAPPAFDVSKVRADDDSGMKIVAGRIAFEARNGRFFNPADVVRGPWTQVSSLETNSLGLGMSSEGRKAGSALCPLGPIVVADVLSRDVVSGRHSVRLTFVVPTRGPIAAYSGILSLVKSSAMRAIGRAVTQASASGAEGQVRRGAAPIADAGAGRTEDRPLIRPESSPTESNRLSSPAPRPDSTRPQQGPGHDEGPATRRPPGSHPR